MVVVMQSASLRWKRELCMGRRVPRTFCQFLRGLEASCTAVGAGPMVRNDVIAGSVDAHRPSRALLFADCSLTLTPTLATSRPKFVAGRLLSPHYLPVFLSPSCNASFCILRLTELL